MLRAENLIGEQEDWAKFITLNDAHKKPLLSSIPVGDKPVARTWKYQAEIYDTPKQSNMPEGKDWDAFESAGENRVELEARIERFDRTASASLIADELGNVAGLSEGDFAREIVKKTEELSRDIECKLGSDDAAHAESGAVQDRTQAMGLWIQSGVTSQLYPTDAKVRPSASQIYTGNRTALTENAVLAVLQAQWEQTGGTGDFQLVCGSELKKRFSEFTRYVPSDLSTINGAMTTNRQMTDKSLSRIVDRYDSDFGAFDLMLSRWLAHTGWGGSTFKSRWRGYGINRRMWKLRWHTKPVWHRLPFKGGSYNAGCYAMLMLACLNPIGEVKFDPADA